MIRRYMLLCFFVSMSTLGCYSSQEGFDAMEIDAESQSEAAPEAEAVPEGAGYQLRQAAAAGNRNEVRRLLRAGVSVNSASGDGMTALHRAAAKNRLRIMHDLISCGAHVNALTRYSSLSPLCLAAEKGNVDAVRLLLAWNADAGYLDANGATSLLNAIYMRQFATVGVLLAHGTDEINTQDDDGISPLSAAITENFVELFKILVRLGAHVNVRNQKNGSLPLHYAAQTGNWDTCRFLLDNGAAANIKDDAGLIPADVARLEGHADLADYLGFIAQMQGPIRSGGPRTALTFVREGS